jgi:flagellin
MNAALGRVDKAIDNVNGARALIGASRSRLDAAYNLMAIFETQMSSSESRIRDADMAKETAALMKNNVLINAAHAMLAQANILPQGVLMLLR